MVGFLKQANININSPVSETMLQKYFAALNINGFSFEWFAS